MDFEKSKKIGDEIREKMVKHCIDTDTKNIIDAVNYLLLLNKNLSYEEMFYILKNKFFTVSKSNYENLNIKYIVQAVSDIKNGHKYLNVLCVNFVYNPFLNSLMRNVGNEAVENLHMAKKEYYMDTPYARKHQIFNNCYELEPKLKTTKGIYIDADSQSSKSMANNEYLLERVFAHISELKNGSIVKIDNKLEFKTGNFYYALHNADILNMYINNQGYVDLLVADTYDFNEKDTSGDLVKLAYEHQVRGDLVPYFIFYHVQIPKKVLGKI